MCPWARGGHGWEGTWGYMWLEVAQGHLARGSMERCLSCVGHREECVAGAGDMERDVAGQRHETFPAMENLVYASSGFNGKDVL